MYKLLPKIMLWGDFMRSFCATRFLLAITLIALAWAPGIATAQDTPGVPNVVPDDHAVNMTTGKVSAPPVSAVIGADSPSPLEYDRSINSEDLTGWSSNYGLVLADATYYDWGYGGSVCRVGVTQGLIAEMFNCAGGSPPSFTPDRTNGASLVSSAAPPYGYNFVFTDKNRTSITFPVETATCTSGANLYANYPSSIAKANGEIITFYYRRDYDGSGCITGRRITSVVSNFGYQLHLDYMSNTPGQIHEPYLVLTKVTAIDNAVDFCDPSATSCPAYTQSWPNITFTTVLPSGPVTAKESSGPLWSYSRSDLGSGNAKVDIQRDGVIWKSYNALSGAVKSVTEGGNTWTYNFAIPPFPAIASTLTGTRTDSLSNVLTTTSAYIRGQVFVNTDELSRSTKLQYDGGNRLKYLVPPEGTVSGSSPPTAGYAENTYDTNGNVTQVTLVPKSGSGLPNIVTTASFGTACSGGVNWNKPCSTVNANGQTSDFTYSSVHGGVLTQLGPAAVLGTPLSTVTGRPLKVSTYAQRYAWIKNASSGWTALSSSPVWLISTVTDCQSVVPPASPPVCDGTKPQTVTTYEYGAQTPANRESLLVKGVAVTSSGTTLRTCYGYDAFGRRISETKPNANLGSCS